MRKGEFSNMGKEKSVKRGKQQRHAPLGQQIEDAGAPKTHSRKKARDREQQFEDEESRQQFVEAKLSDKILKQARQQQDEVAGFGATSGNPRSRNRFLRDGNDSEDSDMELTEQEFDRQDQTQEFYDSLHIDEGDEQTLERLMNRDAPKRQTLADIIMSKIHEKETEIATQLSEANPMPDLDPKIIKVYSSVGQILARYRSGKMPKAFKIIPSLKNWEELLYITEPDGWTAAAMYQGTRIFTSNLNARMAQRFFNLILLPRVRDDISEYKRLNFHLFMSLKKALFKPAAFFKGILLPLCEAGDCTLREAVIVSSVLSRTSIPVLHSSAAMLKIAEMPYNGANSIFLRVLLDKKYALPYRVIDALVHHFYRFLNDPRELPVLWHQCMLVFVQRYKEDITEEQKTALIALLRNKGHEGVAPDIRWEIVNSKSRGCDEIFEEPRDVAMTL